MNAAIDAALVAADQAAAPRSYLGGSRLGQGCERALQFDFVKAPKDEGADFDGRLLRIFGIGHALEDVAVAWLRAAGFDLYTRRGGGEHGQQCGFSVAGGRIRGHVDGVFAGAPPPRSSRSSVSSSSHTCPRAARCASWASRQRPSIAGMIAISAAGPKPWPIAPRGPIASGTASAMQRAGNLVAQTGGQWTATHRGQGRAHLAVRLKLRPEAFPSGAPSLSAIVDGADTILDPRKGATGWSDNPALCLAWYLTSPFGWRAAWADIDLPALMAAANICDEIMCRRDGTAGRRYTVNGTVTLGEGKIVITRNLVAAIAGALVVSDGRFYIHAGAPALPAATLSR